MIVFRKLKWRNFLSTGNVWNEVQLDRSTTTLIIGKNGEGKSTILDALTFCLFGKPFRNIKIPQLVNSINQKGTETEIEFTVGTVEYRFYRSIKPYKFQVWQNGIEMDQNAARTDFQKILETQILKLNYKSFTQMVILGSASFVPFMQLPSGTRRQVIEDVLDISIFSQMNELLKNRISMTKEELKDAEKRIEVARTQVDAQQKIINSISTIKEDQVARTQAKIAEHEHEVKSLTELVDRLGVETQDLMGLISDQSDVQKNIARAQEIQRSGSYTNDKILQQIEFFTSNDVCPSCQQGIEHEHKNSLVQDLSRDAEKQKSDLNTIEKALERLTTRLKEISAINEQIMSKNSEISANNRSISQLNGFINQLKKDVEDIREDTSNIDEQKKTLKDLAAAAVSAVKRKTELQEQRNLEEVSWQLLRDTGVKTAIIREYLPVINKLINKYLQAMDFFVHFELDENFNETIKSRYRDEFTYASFSEGEKMRIDLAILFTWRQIAKMKNSINTNLLILDEIFDSSLDTAGTDYFLNVLEQTNDSSNVFVISHKGDQLFDKFRSVIRFEKKNDFSVISQGGQ